MQDQAEKAYCCGNSAQNEAKLISKFDLFLACSGLVSRIALFTVALTKPETLGDLGNTTSPENATIATTVLMMSSGAQIATMTISIVWNLFEIALAILLLVGAMQKNHVMLLTWFVATIGACSVKFAVWGFGIIYLKYEQYLLSASLVLSFLYNWYCLWIVKILMREVTSVGGDDTERGGYANPIDDDFGIETAGGIPMDKF